MIKQTVVAGSFYPNDETELLKIFDNYFNQINIENFLKDFDIDSLVGVIVPHAGYIYSGRTAAYAYKLMQNKDFESVVIIAPSHYSGFFDFSIGDYTQYETPLGNLNVNQDIVKKLLTYDKFCFSELAEKREHSLEIQLPFLKYIKPNVNIIPIIVGNQNYENSLYLSKVLNDVLDDKTMIIVSSDLSHFYKADVAEKLDRKFIELVQLKQVKDLWDNLINHNTEACGFGGVLTLLEFVRLRYNDFIVEKLNYTHSGYISNDFYQVVGYYSGAFFIR
ncbi:MAG: AmmeMemoRadiSam system protein B [Candidatus Cloacimonetes bacterium]|jgi:hypothetical protein|nr:AmmeMemoRadiSam system protein B [Candidatus Cloacimonadota bacterium]MDD4156195.1 AmmeMemoRadiSam system protein B [Candidatus Cloacimonadota bacterium]